MFAPVLDFDFNLLSPHDNDIVELLFLILSIRRCAISWFKRKHSWDIEKTGKRKKKQEREEDVGV